MTRTTAANGAPLVLVTVGTDHHPFDRLIGWVDGWLRSEAPEPVRCVCQIGTSRPPRDAEWHEYVANEELRAWMHQAAAVVSHGGPGSIMDCRRMGSIPIVVPRKQALGEHVDDHQVAFTRRIAGAGLILLADTEEEFRDHLGRRVEDGVTPVARTDVAESSDALREFERLVQDLMSDHGPRTTWPSAPLSSRQLIGSRLGSPSFAQDTLSPRNRYP
jgi:UDP-N-acetylglucosamine transferase subunit ALG13